jgi:predicted RNA-binding protein with PIN domain
MTLIIDGYNLLHASGILGRGVGPGGLERSRAALLNFLVESLDARTLARTTVVFDARDPPPGLPRTLAHRALSVRFADPGGDADQVIEELIRADSAPRRLTVVSSDHRLHRAAKRRGAHAVDSDIWYHEIVHKRIDRMRRKTSAAKPSAPPSEGEVHYWLRRFGLESVDDASSSDPPTGGVFPPGYAEDVRDDE